MFCRYCGKELKDGEVCSCQTSKQIQKPGQTSGQIPGQIPGQAPQANAGWQNTTVPPAYDNGSYDNGSYDSGSYDDGSQNKKKSHKGLIIGLIIGGAVLVAAAASAAVILIYNGSHKGPKNQQGIVTETKSDDQDMMETESSKDSETVPETEKNNEIEKLKTDYEAGTIDYAQVKQALNSLDTDKISEEDADTVIALQEKAEADLTEKIEGLIKESNYMEAFKTLTQMQEKVPDDKLISELKEKYEVDFILQIDSESKKLLKEKKTEEAVKLLEEAKKYVSDKALMDELIEGIKNAPEESDYIIPDSNSRYLTMADVEGLSLREINYAKNEIYARHGRRFASKELQNYFNSKSWYKGTVDAENFDGSVFNAYERANADFLSEVEFSIDSKGYQLDAG